MISKPLRAICTALALWAPHVSTHAAMPEAIAHYQMMGQIGVMTCSEIATSVRNDDSPGSFKRRMASAQDRIEQAWGRVEAEQ